MSLQINHPDLLLRPAANGDEPLLQHIYASTRTEEMNRVAHWTAAEKDRFLQQQFFAQHTWYQANYGGAFFWVIEHRGTAIGRLYLHPDFEDNSVRIIDISLLPHWRNQGLGTAILEDIIAFAKQRHKTVSIHVESFNPAMQLYRKLGFEPVSTTNGVYHLLQWQQHKTVPL